MTELLQMTLCELTDTLQAKRASPVDLMRACLDRIESTHAHLNAVVFRRPEDELLAEATAAEARIARGEARPLEGIPLGVKDLEDVGGLPTTYGSKPWEHNIATEDSTQVSRLKAAGAIVVGKTNAPEFGSEAITKNLIFGATRSPWSPDHTPGGSSGGSSALLAGEVLPLVTASDGGGSVRIPASFVGAMGLKPSYGRIPKGPLDEWEHGYSVHGPLTKTVEDAALVLDVTCGHDPRDPRSLPHPGISYRESLKTPPRKLKLAYSRDLGYAVVQSDVAKGVDDAVEVFRGLGHEVTEITHPAPFTCVLWGILGAYEIGARIAHLRPGRDGDINRGLLATIDAAAYMTQLKWGELSEARVEMTNWIAQVHSEYDLLLTPTVPYDPPPPRGPYPLETEGRQHRSASVGYFTIPFNLTWNPAASVRAGLSNAGLPIGLQIVGPHHRDELVLQAALAFERERYWGNDWPMR